MASVRVNISSVSWIDRDRMSPFTGMPMNIFSSDAWLDQLCFGMRHTANNPPPATFDGGVYLNGLTLAYQYRSVTSFTLELDLDPQGKLLRFRQWPGSHAILDAGYTAPFDSGWRAFLGEAKTTAFGDFQSLKFKS